MDEAIKGGEFFLILHMIQREQNKRTEEAEIQAWIHGKPHGRKMHRQIEKRECIHMDAHKEFGVMVYILVRPV